MVINEQISFGQLIMFYSYIGMLVWPMMAVGWVVNVLQRGKASYQRLMEIMKSKSNVPEPEKIDAVVQANKVKAAQKTPVS